MRIFLMPLGCKTGLNGNRMRWHKNGELSIFLNMGVKKNWKKWRFNVESLISPVWTEKELDELANQPWRYPHLIYPNGNPDPNLLNWL